MRRKILFRGISIINKDNKKFVFGNLKTLEDRSFISSENNLIDSYIQVDPYTVGMFTGKYDGTKLEDLDEEESKIHDTSDGSRIWNGREIFEDDIIAGYCFELSRNRLYYLIFWDDGWFCKNINDNSIVSLNRINVSNFEVIGNIHITNIRLLKTDIHLPDNSEIGEFNIIENSMDESKKYEKSEHTRIKKVESLNELCNRLIDIRSMMLPESFENDKIRTMLLDQILDMIEGAWIDPDLKLPMIYETCEILYTSPFGIINKYGYLGEPNFETNEYSWFNEDGTLISDHENLRWRPIHI